MKLKELLKKEYVEKLEDNSYHCLACNKIFTRMGVINHHFYEHEDEGIKKKQILKEKALKNNNTPEMKEKISKRTKEAFQRDDVKKNFQQYVERQKIERQGEGNPMYGKTHTEEWKRNHLERMTGFEHTEEFKEDQRQRRLNTKHKPESIQKMRLAKIGKRASFETKLKMSQSHKSNSHCRLTIKKINKKYPFFSIIEEMRYNPDKPKEKEIQIHCRNHNCSNSKEKGGWFTPKDRILQYRIYALETSGDYNGLYCSEDCKQSCSIYGVNPADIINSNNSSELPYTKQELQTWRTQIKELDNSKCQICGTIENIHVHHIIPQKLQPFFALDPDNGICLCKKCHYKHGHSEDECSTGKLAKTQCKEY